jgi:hypothetical protein
MSDGLTALRRANPRSSPGFDDAVAVSARSVRAALAAAPGQVSPGRRARPRRRLLGASALAAVVGAVAVLAGVVALGSSGSDAAAALRQAAAATAAPAEQSGTAVVEITQGGRHWAGTTVRWNGDDLSLTAGPPPAGVPLAGPRARTGREMLLVDGMMYGIDPEDGGWVRLGSPDSIDPGSGTTPAEILRAVREDVGGATLRRVLGGMTGLVARELEDGSTAYAGRTPAGLIARETGFKDGERLRVLPFGFVAHGEGADPDASIGVTVTVGADGLVREVAAVWGGDEGPWRYSVTYTGLGATDAPTAPANAKPLRKRGRS